MSFTTTSSRTILSGPRCDRDMSSSRGMPWLSGVHVCAFHRLMVPVLVPLGETIDKRFVSSRPCGSLYTVQLSAQLCVVPGFPLFWGLLAHITRIWLFSQVSTCLRCPTTTSTALLSSGLYYPPTRCCCVSVVMLLIALVLRQLLEHLTSAVQRSRADAPSRLRSQSIFSNLPVHRWVQCRSTDPPFAPC